MDYSIIVWQYIVENILKIDSNGNMVFTRYPVSKSKLLKDFKKMYGTTIHSFIKDQKVNRSDALLTEHSDYTSKELLHKINWGGGDKSFRNAYKKKFGKNPFKKVSVDVSIPEYKSDGRFYRYSSSLNEILLRTLYLLDQEFKVKWHSKNTLTMTLDVEGTILQSQMFPIEKEWMFYLMYDIENNNIDYFLFIRLLFDKKCNNTFSSFHPYFNIFQNLTDKIEKETGLNLKDTIENWSEYIKGEYYADSFFSSSFKGVELVEHLPNRMVLNENCKIMVDSHAYIENLNHNFFVSSQNEFIKLFGLSIEELKQYCNSVHNYNFEEMSVFISMCLSRIKYKPKFIRMVDLLARLTDRPIIDGDLLTKLPTYVIDDQLDEIYQYRKSTAFPNALCEIRKCIMNLDEDEDLDVSHLFICVWSQIKYNLDNVI